MEQRKESQVNSKIFSCGHLMPIKDVKPNGDIIFNLPPLKTKCPMCEQKKDTSNLIKITFTSVKPIYNTRKKFRKEVKSNVKFTKKDQ